MLRPTITACFPAIAHPVSAISSIIPRGVHGVIPVILFVNFPEFTKWNPSTSFSGIISSSTILASICAGRGSCTIIPWTSSLLLRLSIKPSISHCGTSAGSLKTRQSTPTDLAVRSFRETYPTEAGSSPASIMARQGVMFFFLSSNIVSDILAYCFFATSRPFITVALIVLPLSHIKS